MSEPEVGLPYSGQSSGAPWDKFAPILGTTSTGGLNDYGVVYELIMDGSFSNYQIAHKVNSGDDPNPVLVDPSGNVYGTTSGGGAGFAGELFKLAAGSWKATVLHNFCAEQSCADGRYPGGKLLMDGVGNLFGTTVDGGLCYAQPITCGVIFERPATGGYQVIYKFCVSTGCLDGTVPNGDLTMDRAGHLFGTTHMGGANTNADCPHGCGTVFKLTNDGTQWTETVLYSFCSLYPYLDGGLPYWSLSRSNTGSLIGTTSATVPAAAAVARCSN